MGKSCLFAINSYVDYTYFVQYVQSIVKQEACRPIQPAPHSNYSVLQQMHDMEANNAEWT